MAAEGLISYRAFGRFSDVAIGARTREGALEQALLSRKGVTMADIDVWDGSRYVPVLGFSDLSPEALALILKDCERYHAESAIPISDFREGGAIYFDERQSGNVPDVPTAHPPLTVSLGGDGKIRLATS